MFFELCLNNDPTELNNKHMYILALSLFKEEKTSASKYFKLFEACITSALLLTDNMLIPHDHKVLDAVDYIQEIKGILKMLLPCSRLTFVCSPFG